MGTILNEYVTIVMLFVSMFYFLSVLKNRFRVLNTVSNIRAIIFFVEFIFYELFIADLLRKRILDLCKKSIVNYFLGIGGTRLAPRLKHFA